MRPVSEHHIDGDGPQMLEEAVCRSACDDGGAPFDDRQISRGVKREGKQIQSDQDAGQGSLAVSEIVLEVVSIGFEDVERLVLDLPAGTAAGRRFGDAAGCDREIRNEAVEVGSLPLGKGEVESSIPSSSTSLFKHLQSVSDGPGGWSCRTARLLHGNAGQRPVR